MVRFSALPFLILLLMAANSSIFCNATMFPDSSHAPFELGVASGEPTFDSIVIWTRLFHRAAVVYPELEWSIWETANPLSSVRIGNITATEYNGYSISVLVSGLAANMHYEYQFTHVESGNKSVVGRTRTAPELTDRTSPIKIVTVSCSSIWSGYMNAYQQIASTEDLNLVVHLGDFIYPELDKTSCKRVPYWTDLNCPQECHDQRTQNLNVSFYTAQRNCTASKLFQFRWVYEYYLMDPMVRQVRQAHPFVTIFDNHDLGSSISQDLSADEIRAFLEFTPLLVTNTSGFYRQLNMGAMVNVLALDTRNIGLPNDTYLGTRQTEWLDSKLETDDSQWRLVLTSVAFAPWVVNGWDSFVHYCFGSIVAMVTITAMWLSLICTIKVEQIHNDAYDEIETNTNNGGPVVQEKHCCGCKRTRTRCTMICCGVLIALICIVWLVVILMVQSMAASRHVNLVPVNGEAFVNADTSVRSWSGNPQDRFALLQQLKRHDKQWNNVWASGDLHMSLAADVRAVDPLVYDSLAYGERFGVEMLSSSVSRNNLDEIVAYYGMPAGFIPAAIDLATLMLMQFNPHFRYFDSTEHGYGLLYFTPQNVTAEFWHTPISTASNELWLAKRLVCELGENKWGK